MGVLYSGCLFFFFNDTATTEIYTLSLHDALPIWLVAQSPYEAVRHGWNGLLVEPDRKSTRLNSSHMSMSYADFCLKKKTTSKNVVNRVMVYTYSHDLWL